MTDPDQRQREHMTFLLAVVQAAMVLNKSKHVSPFSPLAKDLKQACAALEEFETVEGIRR